MTLTLLRSWRNPKAAMFKMNHLLFNLMTKVVLAIILIAGFTIGIETQAAPFSKRVSNEFLTELVAKSSSLISKKSKRKISKLIGQLDSENQVILKSCNIETGQFVDQDELIENATERLPSLTPMSERAIFYGVLLQIEQLDSVLAIKDQNLVAQMQDQRLRVRILKQEQRVFGDIRDHVVAEILRVAKNYYLVQQSLIDVSELDFTFPSHLSNLKEVESHVLSLFDQIVKNNSRLLEKYQGATDACA